MTDKNPISEAKRYLDNARTILKEKGNKENRFYRDPKYVKMAGHTAYAGVLLALDACFGDKTKGRKDVGWYKEQLSGMDKTALKNFISAYDLLHVAMSYDGNTDSDIAKLGLTRADEIILWVEQRTVTC
ncbi:DUF5618 family protein [Dyadobacter fermentans]|uniref:DUF5618 domain-containing protein n=1 Tax=Dyadobacter fermentans (strain ATCC 700827 / DSM 18053 / CIP 107007 / KCTC 52180 / NS114) TaxID=471854 RepID=C6W502_DYAFD|nr:DUF5618 family protein [Dyadobacter fermentans]ACT92362.1 hypothetical protein Dfer_1113 [Dyadobacter fermentans DSM 18053]